MDNQENPSTIPPVGTESTSILPLYDFEVRAGDDQTVTLPKNDVDLYGHVLYKSNNSELNIAVLNGLNLNLIWSVKSSTNGAKVDISNQPDLASHAIIKQLQEGTYEFELKLNNKQGTTVASDIVQVQVIASKKIRINDFCQYDSQLLPFNILMKECTDIDEYFSCFASTISKIDMLYTQIIIIY